MTWGPEPFSDAQVQSVVFDQTAVWMQSSSFGKTSIAGTRTPWFRASFAAQAPCDMPLNRAARARRRREQCRRRPIGGLQPRRVPRFLHRGRWPTGVRQRRDDLPERRPDAHARRARARPHLRAEPREHVGVLRGSCDAYEYGDFYDTMGLVGSPARPADDVVAPAATFSSPGVSLIRRMGRFTLVGDTLGDAADHDQVRNTGDLKRGFTCLRFFCDASFVTSVGRRSASA